MTKLYESDVENFTIALLQKQGFGYLSAAEQKAERADKGEVVLKNRLQAAIEQLNPAIPEAAKEQALRDVLHWPHQSLIENNEAFHHLWCNGIEVEYQKNGDTIGGQVWLVDFANPRNNDWRVCNQYTVTENNLTKRADIVLFVNGLPLVVIELKNPTDANATVYKAFRQLQNYKNEISSLFVYNGILVASDGMDAKAGTLTADWNRFMAWKTVDGVKEDPATTPQIETLVKGLLRPDILLDLLKQFTVFERSTQLRPSPSPSQGERGSVFVTGDFVVRERGSVFVGVESQSSKEGRLHSISPPGREEGITQVITIKKIAAYHQYHAVNQAVASTKAACEEEGNRKAGVVWHTQGSGKSLSMLFYVGKIVLALNNPTVVVMTDRNDLDDQLFETFADSWALLRQEPVQANDRTHLKKLLKTSGGGIVFTTIQKFFPDNENEHFDLLSERKNIVVIADEAHRSHYGFGTKTQIKAEGASTKHGFAKYLRDALPAASFVGFTATPIEKEDVSTRAVFGNDIDVYDIFQAVADGATVRIYYESRLAQVHLKADEKETLDATVEAITENEESMATEKAKKKWTQLEAIVGHKERLKTVAADILEHFETRQDVFEGKGMIVTMSRRIAVELYEHLIQLRPHWHDTNRQKGAIKVIMTSNANDPENWHPHHTNKQDRKDLAKRFKDPTDSLKLVIVRDMWLTGFDAPCLHTMYLDKPMRGHNLMQAIARVNRVYKDKPGGLIVDYIGIASDLKQALATYTESGGTGQPTLDQNEAIAAMEEKFEIVAQMFAGFPYQRFFNANANEKMTIILEAQEHILSLDEGKNRFIQQVGLLSKTFALAVPSLQAMAIKAEVGFFQAVKARLTKFVVAGSAKHDVEMETAIKQIVDQALVVEGVLDIFDAAGIKKPDLSILSDEFLAEVRGLKHKNLALELLKKILMDEIKTRTKKNFVQSKKFSEMLEKAIKQYKNKLLTATEVIEELIHLAKEIKASDGRGKALGLSENEIAFYDALAENSSAQAVMGDTTLRDLARILVQKVKTNTSLDWTIKANVRAKLRVIVKRILRKYGYPPDQQLLATENILKQAELFAEAWGALDTGDLESLNLE